MMLKSTTVPELQNSQQMSGGAVESQSKPTLEIGKAKVGEFAALRLAEYDEVPQIGKVIGINDMDVTVQWWMGSYSDNWREWKRKNVVIEEKFPRNAIIKSGITFTRTNRLPKATVDELRVLYGLIEFI